MIKVGVFYPPARRFDWDYYLRTHTPMVERLMRPALRKVEIERGLAGGAPDAPATYGAICHLHFDSVDAFQTAFAPHAAEIMGDIANYTDARPVIQISEIEL